MYILIHKEALHDQIDHYFLSAPPFHMNFNFNELEQMDRKKEQGLDSGTVAMEKGP